jgi:hypothetical protein
MGASNVPRAAQKLPPRLLVRLSASQPVRIDFFLQDQLRAAGTKKYENGASAAK